jgi:hypothetical protein
MCAGLASAVAVREGVQVSVGSASAAAVRGGVQRVCLCMSKSVHCACTHPW